MVLEKKRTNKKTEIQNTVKKVSTRSQLSNKKRNLRIGDICNLKITALAPNNIGIDEYSFSYAIFVPNAKLGSRIKAKILKIQESYAVAQFIEEKKVDTSLDSTKTLNQVPVNPGDVLTVSITTQMEKGHVKPIGVVELANNYRLFVPLRGLEAAIEPLKNTNVENGKTLISNGAASNKLENVKVTVTRVKLNYGFAKIEKLNVNKTLNENSKVSTTFSNKQENGYIQDSTNFHNLNTLSFVEKKQAYAESLDECSNNKLTLEVGCKFTATVPVTFLRKFTLATSKRQIRSSSGAKASARGVDKNKFVVLNINGSIVFLKLKKGRIMAQKLALLEQNKENKVRVRIKITSKSANCAVGKVLQVNKLVSFQEKQPTLLSSKDRTIAALSSLLPSVAFDSSPVLSTNSVLSTNFSTYGRNIIGKNLGSWKGSSIVARWPGASNEPRLNNNNLDGSMASMVSPAIEGPSSLFNTREYDKKRKTALVLNNLREMINHGMHFGEKAVKCHARMKNYIWTVRSLSSSEGLDLGTNSISNQVKNKVNLRKQELERPFIKKGRHVINLLKTRRCLNQALNKLTKYALKGRTFLFIGTKKPAAGLVARASFFTKNSFYVNTRWLGGMLTNWKTICKSIAKIRPILKEKQKVVRNILERRQAIKNRLIKKAFLLKKKSKLILNKGRFLLETLKKERGSRAFDGQKWPSKPSFERGSQRLSGKILNAKKLTALRNDFINKGTQYLERRQKLIQKRRELIYQTLLLKEKGLEFSLKHKAILNQLAIYAKKLREYKYLLILTSEIKNLKVSTAKSSQALLSVSYGKLKEFLISQSSNLVEGGTKLESQEQAFSWILPNPPKEILNKIVLTYLGEPASIFVRGLDENQQNTQLTDSLIKGKSTDLTKQSDSDSDSVLRTRQRQGSGQKGNVSKNNFIVCSTLLSKFSEFSPYIKSIIKNLIKSIKSLEVQANIYSTHLNEIKNTLKAYLSLKQKYVAELQLLKVKFTKERSIIRIVKRKLKVLDAQKKLLKFLPRLRYLPTSQTKISEIVQILLARIVDPKLKYPIDNIYDQKLSTSSKKLAAARKKKWQRLEKYFGGIANMTKLSQSQISRNIAIIIGQKEEINAVHECKKLGIKMFSIVDTNCNPTLSEHIIPANDDSRSSIKYILTKFVTRIRLAQKLRSRLLIQS